MKHVYKIALTSLMTLMFATSGNIKANNVIENRNITDYQMIQAFNFQNSYESSLRTNCTLTFKNDDGTSFEVTFHDISIYQCAKMKVGKWLKETF